MTTDESVRRGEYVRVQQILADQVPTVPLWSPDNEVVHTTRVKNVVPREDGSFGFLRDAWTEP
jgi:peptide/nickel transport system substrate-binding protein